MSAFDDLDLTADERLARDRVRALPPAAAAADADFQARLRAGFVAGTLVSSVPEAPDASAPGAATAPQAGRVLEGPWFLRPSLWAPLAAAAALVFVVSIGNRGPAWEITDTQGEGAVLVDGVAVPAARDGELARLIRRGGRLQLPEGVTLDLVAPGNVALHLVAGSDVVLTPSPDRWFGRQCEVRIESGEVYASTGRAFRGAKLAVVTPEARAEVLGTSFSVMRFASGTCVCVLEGRVRVGSMFDSTSVEVVEGQRRFCYPSQPAYTDSILEDSVHELHRVQEISGSRLGR